MSFYEWNNRHIEEYYRKKCQSATEILNTNHIRFEVSDNGEHITIQTAAGKIDFWPEQEVFRGAANGRGIFPLIREIERIEKKMEKK